MSTLRLFVGLPLPAEQKERLAAVCRRLDRELSFQKWTHPDDFHITLKFLGETPVSRLPSVEEAVRRSAGGYAPFPLSVEGLGCFGPADRPNVLWAGVRGDTRRLSQLKRRVDAALSDAGFAEERRPFRPHITLARRFRGDGRAAAPDAAALRRLAEAEVNGMLVWQAEEIVLYVSHLGKTPSYERAAAYPLYGDLER